MELETAGGAGEEVTAGGAGEEVTAGGGGEEDTGAAVEVATMVVVGRGVTVVVPGTNPPVRVGIA